MMTTHRERVLAEALTDDLYSAAVTVQQILDKVYDRWFCDLDQKEIEPFYAEEIGLIIHLARTYLYNARVTYELETGADRELFPDAAQHLDNAQRYLDNARVTSLNNAAFNISKRLTGAERDKWEREVRDACGLDNESAIKTLQTMIAEKTSTEAAAIRATGPQPGFAG